MHERLGRHRGELQPRPGWTQHILSPGSCRPGLLSSEQTANESAWSYLEITLKSFLALNRPRTVTGYLSRWLPPHKCILTGQGSQLWSCGHMVSEPTVLGQCIMAMNENIQQPRAPKTKKYVGNPYCPSLLVSQVPGCPFCLGRERTSGGLLSAH